MNTIILIFLMFMVATCIFAPPARKRPSLSNGVCAKCKKEEAIAEMLGWDGEEWLCSPCYNEKHRESS